MDQLFGLGALERIDRLFLVADHEHLPPAGSRPAHAFAGEELAGQGADDLPLVRRGVLRLVHQDVVDAAIQLVEHPGRSRPAAQELSGLLDQVGEIERAGEPLFDPVGGQIGVGQGQGVDRVPRHGGGSHPSAHSLQSRLFVKQGLAKLGAAFQQPTGFHPCGRAALAVAGEQCAQRLGEGAGRFRRHRRHPRGVRLVARAAFRKGRRGQPPDRPVQLAHGLVGDLVGIGGAVEAAGSPDPRLGALDPAGLAQKAAQQAAAGLEVGEHRLEALEIQAHRESGIGLGDAALAGQRMAGDAVPGGLGDRRRRRVIHHLESGRNSGLQREATQKLFAERVDGLDFQAPGGLQGASKQRAGLGEFRRIEGPILQPGEAQRQLGIRQHRPFAQQFEQAALHLRGGGFGVGDAKDGLGADPCQQQPRHPVDQGLGLARSGVGGDKGRQGGIGGDPLAVGWRGHDIWGHVASSSPLVDHSNTRARWS